ncbi:transposase family protein [Streptomyces sp. I4(2020)]|uniref:transposase family protein n=1 Tax=Streptomyces TaxID=1883 RepID=UPI0035A997B8
MNVQVITRPDGTPLWFSRAAPGRTHDLTAARAHGIVQACLTRQILVLADRAYQGVGATFRTLLPPPRTAAPLRAVQPRPRQTPGTWRTRLRSARVLARHAQSTLLDPTHQPHRPSHPHPADLELFKMKEAHS